jgi:tetratricopeptide (TPR) repeat protein
MAESVAGKTAADEPFASENQLAEQCISAGDLVTAARLLVDIVAKDQANFRAYNNIGIVSWMRKSWEDAYAMFMKAVGVKPDYADALINLLDAALKLRRIGEILPCFEQALAQSPDNEEIRLIRDGIVQQGDGIYTSERGLMVGVYNPRVEEAQKLIAEGKLFPAMEKLLKINDEEGSSAEVFSGLGVISFYQQRYSDAFALFTESLKLNPTSRDDYLNLLDAAKLCGKVSEAKEFFGQYSRKFQFLSVLSPDFDAAKI